VQITLVRATREHIGDYIGIATLSSSRFNAVATDPLSATVAVSGAHIYMIKVQRRIVGFVSYKVTDYGLATPGSAYISEVQVEPNMRGQGIGTQALTKILEEIRERKNIKTIELLTHPENPAQHLYERLGFRPTGEVVENFLGSGEPRIRMVRPNRST